MLAIGNNLAATAGNIKFKGYLLTTAGLHSFNCSANATQSSCTFGSGTSTQPTLLTLPASATISTNYTHIINASPVAPLAVGADGVTGYVVLTTSSVPSIYFLGANGDMGDFIEPIKTVTGLNSLTDTKYIFHDLALGDDGRTGFITLRDMSKVSQTTPPPYFSYAGVDSIYSFSCP